MFRRDTPLRCISLHQSRLCKHLSGRKPASGATALALYQRILNRFDFALLDNDQGYYVFISYLVDGLPHLRIIEGIALFQVAIDGGMNFGQDLFYIIFGCK